MLVSHCCSICYHKLDGLKQHRFIIIIYVRSLTWVSHSWCHSVAGLYLLLDILRENPFLCLFTPTFLGPYPTPHLQSWPQGIKFFCITSLFCSGSPFGSATVLKCQLCHKTNTQFFFLFQWSFVPSYLNNLLALLLCFIINLFSSWVFQFHSSSRLSWFFAFPYKFSSQFIDFDKLVLFKL